MPLLKRCKIRIPRRRILESPSRVSALEKPSSVTEDKTITKVKSPKSDNQPEKQSRSSDSIKRDGLFWGSSGTLNSNSDNVKSDHNDKTFAKDKTEVNKRPVAVNDEATTESNTPVNIKIRYLITYPL